MNKFLASALLLTAVGEAQAHSHPGIDSLTHALEHLTLTQSASLPYIAGVAIALLAWLLWSIRRPQ